VASAARPTILWRPESLATLRAACEGELRHKRAFVAGARGARERELCVLRVVHPDSGVSLDLEAEVVWVKAEEPGSGLGFALHGMTPAVLDALERFVGAPALDEAAPPSESAAGAQNLFDRVRRLTPRERETMARHGPLPERVALERVWGGAVWEALLQNPQLSAAEVAQIAKNASLPTALVSVLVANAGWLAKSEVQRALLANPRVSGAQLDRVLRALPKNELGRLAEQSGVRPQVKAAARRLLGG
jgi:hypothetical protein